MSACLLFHLVRTIRGPIDSLVLVTPHYLQQRILLLAADEYPGLFTEWYGNGTSSLGAVNVYVSGSRPDPEYVQQKAYRLSALDGRLANLDNQYGPDVYPLISNVSHNTGCLELQPQQT